MGVLQRFERRLSGLVEGAFSKVFKGDVHPVEIASALQRETDDRKTVVGQGKVLVPNDFVVELGRHDHDRLDPWAEPLGEELAAMVREHAAEHSYSFVGPVSVTLELRPDIATGTFRIRSGVAAGEAVDGALVAHPGSGAGNPAPPTGALPGRPRLVVTAGGKAPAKSPAAKGHEQVFYLTHSVTVIGRATEADLRLNDPGVSRRHAEIRQDSGAFWIVDLGSTNGIRIDAAPVARHELQNGDRIEIGSTTLIYQRDED